MGFDWQVHMTAFKGWWSCLGSVVTGMSSIDLMESAHPLYVEETEEREIVGKLCSADL